jgi:hypothetical protein
MSHTQIRQNQWNHSSDGSKPSPHKYWFFAHCTNQAGALDTAAATREHVVPTKIIEIDAVSTGSTVPSDNEL